MHPKKRLPDKEITKRGGGEGNFKTAWSRLVTRSEGWTER